MFLPFCGIEVPQRESTFMLVSEPLLNRIIDNEDKHDQNCVGFYTHHFPPALLDSSFFNLDSLKSLEQKTGLRWNVISTTDSVINFLRLFSADDDTNRVVYFAEQVESDSSVNRILSVGSDDGFILWVNGDSIASIHKGRQMLKHDDLIPIKLRKGKNILLFKVDQGTGDWSLFRKFISVETMRSISLSKVPELYQDIPEWCILPDTSNFIMVKPAHGRNLDSLHILNIGWKKMDRKNQYIQINTYQPFELPEILPLPAGFQGKAIFEIKVVNQSGRIDYREEIPIFFEREANRLAGKLTKFSKVTDDPVYIARFHAVVKMFNLDNDPEAEEYSTRMKAHALLDLYRYELNLSDSNLKFSAGPRVWGYRSAIDNTVQPYRLIIPASLSERPNSELVYNVVFIMRWVAEDDREFWKTQQATSHWRLATRVGYSTFFQTILVMTHGRGIQNYLGDALEEIPLILKQLRQHWKIDTTNISIFAHSNAPMMALNLLQAVKLPIANLGFWSPILPIEDSVINQILFWIKRDYSEIKWFVWQSGEDEKAPAVITRKWIGMIKKIGFEVSYQEEPHSTHYVYLGDPEKEFYGKLKSLK